ncbi:DEAD/DEAH box helicase [Rathayibacter sp. SD072]|uniref:DEAD/DEAH box helicase n=1 Tax=Rathayibacter sp. SD072 TaxID=2781731 RepID=UPI001A97A376|nr:DEAD/DEAH box helicase [Rathayibacter sp. SD072]MBO0984614.1 SNF2 helicase associated domain-containing protein [Rathayibacter sp. SD072]
MARRSPSSDAQPSAAPAPPETPEPQEPFSEQDIRALVGTAAFEKGTAYADEGRVGELQWFGGRTRLFGQVRGSGRSPYAVSVQLREDGGRSILLGGACSCPVKHECKHVAAVLVEALRREREGGLAGPFAGETGADAVPEWRSALAPLLAGMERSRSGIPLGLQFELLPGEPVRRPPGRYNSYRPPPEPRPRLGVRPVRMGDRDRWVRTGTSWRDLGYLHYSHDYDERQIDVVREIQGLLSGHSASSYYSPDTWLYLDGCRSEAIWAALHGAVRAGIGLVMGDRDQTPLRILDTTATASIDVTRTAGGLELRSLVAIGDTPAPEEFGFIGDPAVGLYLWEPGDELRARPVTLVPFAAPLLSSARTFLWSREPIRIPEQEEAAFLTEHYQRLHRLFAIVSRDGSFEAPPVPEPRLGLTLEHTDGAGLRGSWWWRYGVEGARGVDAERLPLRIDGETGYRDPDAEQRVLDSLVAAGIDPESTPALVSASSRRLRPTFDLRGMQTVGFLTGEVERLRELGTVEIEEIGERVEYREAETAPVVAVQTVAQPDSRDWFNLEISVTVNDEAVPLAEIFLALARGDEYMVLPSGVYFALDDERFGRLRELIAEARELSDDPGETLRISRFQSSLWDELVELGVVEAQAAAWRRAVEGLSGFTATGALESRPLPDGFQVELRPYQQLGYDWLSFLYDNQLGGVLADDMGLGKTVQSLALIARAMQEQRAAAGDAGTSPRPFLVIAPTSVVPNWVGEAKRFAPGLTVVGIDETSKKKRRALSTTIGEAELVVTSYALFRLDYESYAGIRWAGLMLDEAQFVKNRQSATHQLARRLDVPFKLAITGTPMENNVMELWSLLSIVAPGLFPSPAGFAEYYQKPIEREADTERLTQLRRRIRPLMLRRTKELVATELPPKQEQTIEVELGTRQRKVYDTYLARERQRVLGLIGDFEKNRFAIFRALTVLRQVALDAALVDEAHATVPSTKLDLLDELLADALSEGHRVLVFSQFTRFLGRVRDRLDGAGIEYAYLDGATKKRDEVIDRFRSGEAGVFLISLKAGGFGLNLTEADYCILLDPWWNPATESQAVDRAHRIGQTRSVMVYRLVAKDTIEEKVMALKEAKAALFAAVMSDDGAAATGGITAEDVRELLG